MKRVHFERIVTIFAKIVILFAYIKKKLYLCARKGLNNRDRQILDVKWDDILDI